MASCPHTIGVEFGTRIIEVDKQKIKLQIWVSLRTLEGLQAILIVILIKGHCWTRTIPCSHSKLLSRCSWMHSCL